MLPNVALLITTYRRPDALALVLESVQKQRHLPNEVLIADDGSAENTKQVIEAFAHSFPKKTKHIWQEDNGFQAAHIRNKAIAQTSMEYLIIIDGDMILNPYFVEDHLNAANANFFIQGSRVLLSEGLTQRAIEEKKDTFSPWQKGIGNRLNAIHNSVLSALFSKEKVGLNGIRSCNMSFWREDALAINGFNEAFVGWGLEDSEFAARLMNNGIRRKNLKFNAVAYHLFHNENFKKENKDGYSVNDALLKKVIEDRITWCEQGINL